MQDHGSKLHVFFCEKLTLPKLSTEVEAQLEKIQCHWYCGAAHQASELLSFEGNPKTAKPGDFCVFLVSDANSSEELKLTIATPDGTHVGVNFGSLDKMATSEQFEPRVLDLLNVDGVICKAEVHCAAQHRWTKGQPQHRDPGQSIFISAADDLQATHIWKYIFPNKPVPTRRPTAFGLTETPRSSATPRSETRSKGESVDDLIEGLVSNEDKEKEEAEERKRKEEAERKRKEEAERKAKEERERKAKEEQKRKSQREEEEKAQKAKEEAERKAKEERERKAKDEQRRKSQKEEEEKARKAKEEAERKKKAEEEKKKAEALKKKQEAEAEALKKKQEAEQLAAEEDEYYNEEGEEEEDLEEEENEETHQATSPVEPKKNSRKSSSGSASGVAQKRVEEPKAQRKSQKEEPVQQKSQKVEEEPIQRKSRTQSEDHQRRSRATSEAEEGKSSASGKNSRKMESRVVAQDPAAVTPSHKASPRPSQADGPSSRRSEHKVAQDAEPRRQNSDAHSPRPSSAGPRAKHSKYDLSEKRPSATPARQSENARHSQSSQASSRSNPKELGKSHSGTIRFADDEENLHANDRSRSEKQHEKRMAQAEKQRDHVERQPRTVFLGHRVSQGPWARDRYSVSSSGQWRDVNDSCDDLPFSSGEEGEYGEAADAAGEMALRREALRSLMRNRRGLMQDPTNGRSVPTAAEMTQEDPEDPLPGYAVWAAGHGQQGRWFKVISRAITTRSEPDVGAARTGVELHRGDAFEASAGVVGTDGFVYLQLADGRGWIFNDSRIAPLPPQSPRPATNNGNVLANGGTLLPPKLKQTDSPYESLLVDFEHSENVEQRELVHTEPESEGTLESEMVQRHSLRQNTGSPRDYGTRGYTSMKLTQAASKKKEQKGRATVGFKDVSRFAVTPRSQQLQHGQEQRSEAPCNPKQKKINITVLQHQGIVSSIHQRVLIVSKAMHCMKRNITQQKAHCHEHRHHICSSHSNDTHRRAAVTPFHLPYSILIIN